MLLYQPLLPAAVIDGTPTGVATGTINATATFTGITHSVGSIDATSSLDGIPVSVGTISAEVTFDGVGISGISAGTINVTSTFDGVGAFSSVGTINVTAAFSGVSEFSTPGTINAGATFSGVGGFSSVGTINAEVTFSGVADLSEYWGVLSVGIRQLITNSGIGEVDASTDWGVHVSALPSSPDKAIVVYDAGGENPNPAWLMDYRSIQVAVRGAPGKYIETFIKLKDVKDLLLGITPQEINGEWIAGITGLGDITPIGYDQERRPELVMNFRVFLEPLGGDYTNREEL